MNETINSLMMRRSMRNFTDQLPTEQQLDTILQAGLRAPSAMNLQCNHITVIKDPAIISELNLGVRSKMDGDAIKRMSERCGTDDFSIFYKAPCVMLISSNFELKDYNNVDIGITISNICTATEAVGLNSCIIGMVRMFLTTDDSASFVAKLGLPKGQVPVIAVAIGHGCMDMPTPAINEGRYNYL